MYEACAVSKATQF